VEHRHHRQDHVRAEQPSASGSADAYECSTVERCEYSAPFGLPVVPDV
jgi:hypothetical protein